MNFLAHLALSNGEEEIMIGNAIADFTRRKLYEDYSEGVQKGIALHHFIDEFTDSHPLVKEMLEVWRPMQAKYSGVVNDIVMDHFLAQSFARYHDKDLALFADEVYSTFNNNWLSIPERARHTFTYMQRGNWLLNYQYREGLERSLSGMSRRAQNMNRMAQASLQLYQQEDFFRNQFERFYPELQEAVRQWG